MHCTFSYTALIPVVITAAVHLTCTWRDSVARSPVQADLSPSPPPSPRSGAKASPHPASLAQNRCYSGTKPMETTSKSVVTTKLETQSLLRTTQSVDSPTVRCFPHSHWGRTDSSSCYRCSARYFHWGITQRFGGTQRQRVVGLYTARSIRFSPCTLSTCSGHDLNIY